MEQPSLLSLAEGRRLYLKHVQRPRIVGGARPSSAKRYRPVFDKFAQFAQAEGITPGIKSRTVPWKLMLPTSTILSMPTLRNTWN